MGKESKWGSRKLVLTLLGFALVMALALFSRRFGMSDAVAETAMWAVCFLCAQYGTSNAVKGGLAAVVASKHGSQAIPHTEVEERFDD